MSAPSAFHVHTTVWTAVFSTPECGGRVAQVDFGW